MDPLTHGLVGAALSTFSGTAAGFDNPITIGAMLGAMSPDLDFVIRIFKNDAAYLEHHRGVSHTVPFLAGFSVAITLILSQMGFVAFDFWLTLLWTFVGALSHTGLDILNSYGAKFIKRKLKVNILTLYDPVITLVGIFLIFNGENTLLELTGASVIVASYLYVRSRSKSSARMVLQSYFCESHLNVSVHVMPALKAFHKWDYVVHTDSHDIVGTYNPIKGLLDKRKGIEIIKTFKRNEVCYYDVFRATEVGRIFTHFSPNLHINVTHDDENDQIVLRAVDLRYFFKENFMHHATLVLDKELNHISSFLHPYKINKAIPVYE